LLLSCSNIAGLKLYSVVFIDKPIFSIDVHPDGTRFATAGQGNT